MHVLTFTPAEFECLLRCYQRIRVADMHTAMDPRPYLVARLRESALGVAAKVEALDALEADELWSQLLEAIAAGDQSVLWN